MTQRFTHWSAANVAIVWGGLLIDGFADGEGASLEFNEDAFSLTVGIDGFGTRNKILNRSARLTLNLMAASTYNDALGAAYLADQLATNGAGVAPLTIRDGNGRSLFTAAEAWIVQVPSFTVDQEAGTRTWVLEMVRLEASFGGL